MLLSCKDQVAWRRFLAQGMGSVRIPRSFAKWHRTQPTAWLSDPYSKPVCPELLCSSHQRGAGKDFLQLGVLPPSRTHMCKPHSCSHSALHHLLHSEWLFRRSQSSILSVFILKSSRNMLAMFLKFPDKHPVASNSASSA